MRKFRKSKPKPDLPELCAAVRRIRKATGWSQEKMAQETRIATQTISRFELGKQVPRDYLVLAALSHAADDAGLVAEKKLFDNAMIDQMYEPGGLRGWAPPRQMEPGYITPQMWRLMQAARIANLFFPDAARAMEQAAGPALALVDEIIANAATDRNIDVHFYSDLESELSELAARKVFQNLKKEGGQ